MDSDNLLTCSDRNDHNWTNDTKTATGSGSANAPRESVYATTKEKKELRNSEILCRSSSKHSSDTRISESAISNESSSHLLSERSLDTRDENTGIASKQEVNIDASRHDNSGTAEVASVTNGVRAKTNAGACKESFVSQRTQVQSVEIEEEKPDAKTPVYEDVDPAQALLSQHRLAAYLASPDCQPECPTFPLPSGDGYGYNTHRTPLSVGQCSPDLAEAALQSVGTVTRLPNNVMAFVADDLHNKIRLASPGSAGASYQASGASTPRLPYLLTPVVDRPPPLDPTLLNDIERHARRLATNVDGLIESLTDALHGISALTVDCVETYRDAVCKTCDSVDANIKSMYQLMAKGEELSKSMKPVYSLHAQIKDVRRTLDLLDAEMHSSGS